MRIML